MSENLCYFGGHLENSSVLTVRNLTALREKYQHFPPHSSPLASITLSLTMQVNDLISLSLVLVLRKTVISQPGVHETEVTIGWTSKHNRFTPLIFVTCTSLSDIGYRRKV